MNGRILATALALGWVLGLSGLVGPARGQQAAGGGGRGVQVQSCSYWDQRIADARQCVISNRKKARDASASSSFAKSYNDAANACQAAIGKYEIEKQRCGPGGPGGPGGGPGGGPNGGGPDPNEQLQQALQQLAQLGQGQAAQGIEGIRNAASGLTLRYDGAGIKIRINLLLGDTWTDDHLADVGDMWPLGSTVEWCGPKAWDLYQQRLKECELLPGPYVPGLGDPPLAVIPGLNLPSLRDGCKMNWHSMYRKKRQCCTSHPPQRTDMPVIQTHTVMIDGCM